MLTRARPILALAAVLLALPLLVAGPVVADSPSKRPMPTTVPGLQDSEVLTTAGSGRANMVVEAIEVRPSIPLVGRLATIRVTVANRGNGYPTDSKGKLANFWVDLFVDPPVATAEDLLSMPGYPPTASEGVQASWLAPGETYVVLFEHAFAESGMHDLYAVVDIAELDLPIGNVDEGGAANEGDNAYGPLPVEVRQPNVIIAKDNADFVRGPASSLAVVPVPTPDTDGGEDQLTGQALVYGDAALTLGYFEEPPRYDSPDQDPLHYFDLSRGLDTKVNREKGDDGNEVPGPREAVRLASAEGLLVAVWQDRRNSPLTDWDIYLSWSHTQGQTWAPDLRVNDDGAGNDQKRPAVTISALDNCVLVVWHENRDGTYRIWGQWYYYHTGVGLVTIGGNFPVSPAPAGDALSADVTIAGDGRVYVVWQENLHGSADVKASFTDDLVRSVSNAIMVAVPDRIEVVATPLSADGRHDGRATFNIRAQGLPVGVDVEFITTRGSFEGGGTTITTTAGSDGSASATLVAALPLARAVVVARSDTRVGFTTVDFGDVHREVALQSTDLGNGTLEITAVVEDLCNGERTAVPDGTVVVFRATSGSFDNGQDAFRTYTKDGEASVQLRLPPGSDNAAAVVATVPFPAEQGGQWSTPIAVGDSPSLSNQRSPRVVEGEVEVLGEWQLVVGCDQYGRPVFDVETKALSLLAIAWEDDRNGPSGSASADVDVYWAFSVDRGQSFSVDRRANDDEVDAAAAMQPAQLQPAVSVAQGYRLIELEDKQGICPEKTGKVWVPEGTLYLVWQDYRNDTDAASTNIPDIFMGQVSVFADPVNPAVLRVEPEANERLGAEESARPSWQGYPDVACNSDRESARYDCFIVWADSRNRGEGNYDIYMTVRSSDGDTIQLPEVKRVGDVQVNSGAHVKCADSSDLSCNADPPPAHQIRPSVAADIVRTLRPDLPNVGLDQVVISENRGYVYVAWDDNREGSGRRDIWFTRSNLTYLSDYQRYGPPRDEPKCFVGTGSYISPVYDAGTDSVTWDRIEWVAETPPGTFVTLQTRISDTLTGVNDTQWSPVDQRYRDTGCPLWGYSMSGQPVVDAAGNQHPQGRYIQYRVNMWTGPPIRPDLYCGSPDDPGVVYSVVHTPVFYSVSLHHEARFHEALLPLVRNQGPFSLPPSDPRYHEQWNLEAVRAPVAWAVTRGANGPIVAVIDSGVDLGHPDLSGNLVAGWDFVEGDGVPQDGDGHGTHVAGIMGALGHNGMGVAGLNWQARIMPLRVFPDSGDARLTDVVKAIRWAVDQGARVINLSLSGDTPTEVEREAIQYALSRGAVVIAAAGNEKTGRPEYPAAYPGVIGVGATDRTNTVTAFSNEGPFVDVVAPGKDVLSTYPRALGIEYEYASGTSMATPHAAGLAALIWAGSPWLTAGQLADTILSTALDLGPAGRDDAYGHGLIDAGLAVAGVSRSSTDVYLQSIARKEAILVQGEPTPSPDSFVPGVVLVRLADGVSVSDVQQAWLGMQVQAEPEDPLLPGWVELRVPLGQELQILNGLSGMAGVQAVSLDYYRYAQ